MGSRVIHWYSIIVSLYCLSILYLDNLEGVLWKVLKESFLSALPETGKKVFQTGLSICQADPHPQYNHQCMAIFHISVYPNEWVGQKFTVYCRLNINDTSSLRNPIMFELGILFTMRKKCPLKICSIAFYSFLEYKMSPMNER